MVLKTEGQASAQPVDKAVKTEIEWLIDRNDGAPNFEMRKFRIRPGGSIPKHYHQNIEHEQYALSGHYRVGIGDQTYDVKAGDSLYIPSGTVHWYDNPGEEDAVFLCIIPKKEEYAAVYIDDSEGTTNPAANKC